MKPGVLSSAVLSWITAAVIALLVQWSIGLGPLFPWKVMAIFGFGAVLVVVLSTQHLESRSFGRANRVTLARSALTAMLFAMIGEAPNTDLYWLAVLIGLLALASDGLDGWLARSRGEVSNFGARFDMETDALLILGLAVLAWIGGKAGTWILAAGLMRYIFVALSYLLPWMGRPLPPSLRRKVICVVQELSLIVSLTPLFPPSISQVVALAGLTLLSVSFAIDIGWLRAPAAATSHEGDAMRPEK